MLQGDAGAGCAQDNPATGLLQRSSRFFLLHAAKVRSSCEEGPGQSALQSAYHNPKLDVRVKIGARRG